MVFWTILLYELGSHMSKTIREKKEELLSGKNVSDEEKEEEETSFWEGVWFFMKLGAGIGIIWGLIGLIFAIGNILSPFLGLILVLLFVFAGVIGVIINGFSE